MSKLKMLSFEAVTLQNRAEKLVRKLQKMGVCHIEKCDDERLLEFKTADKEAACERNMQACLDALDVLSKNGVKVSSGLFSTRKPIEERDFDLLYDEAEKYLEYAKQIVEYKKKIDDASVEVSRCRTVIDSLSVWKTLDTPICERSTKHTCMFCGTFPIEYTRQTLGMALCNSLPEKCEYDFEIVYSSKTLTAVCFVCHKDVKDELERVLRGMSFLPPAEKTDITAASKISQLEDEIKNLDESAHLYYEQIVSLKDKAEQIKLCYDFYSTKSKEYAALSSFGASQRIVYFKGYVPDECSEKVKIQIEKFGGAIVFSNPDEDEDVPVALKNSSFSEPVESIVGMYALPGKDDIDPTGVMAFFYYFLFGMMLSDAGYGLIMTVGTWIILKKNLVEGAMRKTMKMYFYCGISTVFWGAMFGSWFGDIYQIVLTNFFGYETAPSIALWFEPIKDPITLLLFSFVVGICHLFLGLTVFGVMQWKKGDKASAIFDTVPIMLTVLGAAPLAASILAPNIPTIVMDIAKYVAIAGVVLIVFTNSRSSKNIVARLGGGLYGLYNIASGYLSDILSYSRLLALGLATGSIASVVNMMGAMPENLVLKGVVLTVVFIVGHVLNMAINVLGAYVHTNRLQFVELFSKFYEGGGRAFEPLKTQTKYFRIMEEKENDN